jgi:leader peptidase (prepilin peptidase)/N-methyltransferase
MPKDISIVKPFSFCPNCKTPLKWYDNIPLLGYLFLRGRCRYCNEKISIKYPMVEFITAVLFLVLYMKFGITIDFFRYVFLFTLCLVISFIDIEYFAIPVYLCVLGIIVALIFSSVESMKFLKQGLWEWGNLPIYKAGLGLMFGLGFTYFFKLCSDIILNVYLYLRKKESIEGEKESLGLGDVDFMGMVGVFLGWKAVLFVFFLAPFFGLLYAGYALIFKKSHLIPYLPYLSLAVLVEFFWGAKILSLIF